MGSIKIGTKLYKAGANFTLQEYTYLGTVKVKGRTKYKVDNGEAKTITLAAQSFGNLCLSKIIILSEIEEQLRRMITDIHVQMRTHKVKFNPLDTVNTVYVGKKNTPGEMKSVHQYHKVTGRYIASYRSAKEAAREVGGNENSTHIGNVCKGTRKTAHGYMWSYDKVDAVKKVIPDYVAILEYSLTGEFIQKHPNITAAAKYCNSTISNLSRAMREHKGRHRKRKWIRETK